MLVGGSGRRSAARSASLAAQRGQLPAVSDRQHHASSGWVPLRSAPTPASAQRPRQRQLSAHASVSARSASSSHQLDLLGPQHHVHLAPLHLRRLLHRHILPAVLHKALQERRQAEGRGEGVCLLNMAWASHSASHSCTQPPPRTSNISRPICWNSISRPLYFRLSLMRCPLPRNFWAAFTLTCTQWQAGRQAAEAAQELVGNNHKSALHCQPARPQSAKGSTTPTHPPAHCPPAHPPTHLVVVHVCGGAQLQLLGLNAARRGRQAGEEAGAGAGRRHCVSVVCHAACQQPAEAAPGRLLLPRCSESLTRAHIQRPLFELPLYVPRAAQVPHITPRITRQSAQAPRAHHPQITHPHPCHCQATHTDSRCRFLASLLAFSSS